MTILTKVQTNGVDFSGSTNLNIDGGTLFVDATNNRVGVGTSSPASKLTIAGTQGNFRVDSDSVTNEVQLLTTVPDNSGFRNYRIRSNQLFLDTSGSTALTIDTSQRVGVGTTSPVDTLHVVGAARFGDGTNFAGVSASASGSSFEAAAGSANVLFKTGGSERLRIDSSGRVGIGTSSPSNILSIAEAGGPTVRLTDSTSGVFGLIQSGSNGDFTISADHGNAGASTNILFKSDGATERMRIDSSGRVGIGTSSPVNIGAGYNGLTVNGSTAGTIYLQGGGTSGGRLLATSTDFYIGTVQAGGNLIFQHQDGSYERARIDSSGRLLVGTSSVYADSSELFEVYKANGPNNGWVSTPNLANDDSVSWRALGGVSGASLRQSGIGVYKHSGIATPCGFLYIQAQNADTYYYWTDNSSNFRISSFASNIGTTGGTVVGTQTSDERLKNILGPVEYGLESVKQIEPVRYTLKTEPDIEKLGFIAQQVQPLVPQTVFDTKEHIEGEPEDAPTKLGMEYVALIPVLVNAIKELSAEVDALKAQLQLQ